MKVYIIRCMHADKIGNDLEHSIDSMHEHTPIRLSCTHMSIQRLHLLLCRFNNFFFRIIAVAIENIIQFDVSKHSNTRSHMHDDKTLCISISMSTLKFIVFDTNPAMVLLYGGERIKHARTRVCHIDKYDILC